MSKQIAIVTCRSVSFNYGDDYSTIIAGITDWSTVTDQEYEDLEAYCRRNSYGGDMTYHVIQRLDHDPTFIPKTLAEFKKHKEKEEARLKKERAAAEAERLQREAKRREKAEAKKLKALMASPEQEKELFLKLKEKFEGA